MNTTIARPEVIIEQPTITEPFEVRGTTLGDLIRGSRVPQNKSGWFTFEGDEVASACALGTALIEAAYRDAS